MRLLLALSLLLTLSAQAQVPSDAWQHRNDMLHSAWRTHGPDAPVAMLAAQIHQESGWNCNAVSWAGAKGCAQFTDATAKGMATQFPQDCQPANQFNEKWSWRCRDLLMNQLKTKPMTIASLSECDDWAFRLRGYNGSPRWTYRDRSLAEMAGDNPDNWVVVQPYNSGRKKSAWVENTEYPVRIFRLEERYTSWGRTLSC